MSNMTTFALYVVLAIFGLLVSSVGAISADVDPDLERFMEENHHWAHEELVGAFDEPNKESLDDKQESSAMRAMESDAAHDVHAFIDELHSLEDHISRSAQRKAQEARRLKGRLRTTGRQ